MKAMVSLVLLLCGFILASAGSVFSAEAKPAWQATWEKTVAAAKKEGKLNFYVGRYGSEPLLNEFRKEFPEIKLVTVNGAGNTLGTRIITEIRAGNVVADLFSGGANTNYEILYEGKALDSIKSTLILPEVLDESKWYEGRHRYTDPEQRHIFDLHRQSFIVRLLLQYQPGESEGVQILLGSGYAAGGKESTFPRNHPARAWELRCNFFITIPSSARNISGGYSAICSRLWAGTGGRLPIGWRKEDTRSASAAGIRRGRRARDCRSTSSITSSGKREFNSLPAAAR